MTKRLSNAFFGDKKLTESLYAQLTSNLNSKNRIFTQKQIHSIFKPYTDKIQTIKSNDGQNTSLLSIFSQFMCLIAQKFSHWKFQKFSSVMQISAHVFEHSFENWLKKDQSYKYFSEVIVRHSLFRPPHSVSIFSYEQMREVTEFWIDHFLRFYEEYEECFKSKLQQTLNAVSFPQKIDKQISLNVGKITNKENVLKLI